jgi:hypothetical protein
MGNGVTFFTKQAKSGWCGSAHKNHSLLSSFVMKLLNDSLLVFRLRTSTDEHIVLKGFTAP